MFDPDALSEEVQLRLVFINSEAMSETRDTFRCRELKNMWFRLEFGMTRDLLSVYPYLSSWLLFDPGRGWMSFVSLVYRNGGWIQSEIENKVGKSVGRGMSGAPTNFRLHN